MTHVEAGEQVAVRRRRDPKGTREKLVRAALELFTSRGYHTSTTTEIASRAGIAEGTIYRHFATKAQLLNEIYRAALRLLTRPIAVLPSEESCKTRLTYTAAEWRDLAVRDPALIKLVFNADLDDLLDAKSRDARRQFRAGLEQLVASGKASGEIRLGSVEVWTDVWLRLVVLVLERTAAGTWAEARGPGEQVLESAWRAISVSG